MDVIAAVSDPRSEFYPLMRRENMPANELMGRRMEIGVLAVLGPAAGHAQLAPDRPRVVVRRRAGDRAGRARSGSTSRRAARGGRRTVRVAAGAASERQRDLEELVLAGEDLRHRVVGEDPPDRVGEDVGAGELAGSCPGAPARSGTVSVTTIPASGEAASVSNAGPEKTPWVATA